MNNKINLLDYKNKVNPIRDFRGEKQLRLLAISLLFIVSVSSVIIFILIALSPIPQLENQQKSGSVKLSLSQQDIVKLSLLKERVKTIKSLTDKRTNYDSIFESIGKLLPTGVTISSLNTKSNAITLMVSSKSLLLLENFLSKLNESEKIEKRFSNIKILSLSTLDSSDNFSLTVSFRIL